MGKLLAVASGKGGTGKTSLCAAIASCLAAEGQRVLCIDADIGLRNLDLSLGLADEATIPFSSVISGAYPLTAAATHPQLPGLALLTAPQSLEELTQEMLERFCTEVRERFDFCLIDAPAGLGAGFRLAAAMADAALIVTGAEPASLRDGAVTAAALRGLGVEEGYVIVNRVQPKLYEKIQLTVDDVMDRVGLPLLGLVPEDVRVTLAVACGKPLALLPHKGAWRACSRIASRLLGRHILLPNRL